MIGRMIRKTLAAAASLFLFTWTAATAAESPTERPAASKLYLQNDRGPALSAGGGEQALLAKYPAIKGSLEKNQFGSPIYLESKESDNSVRVDMYGIFDYRFDQIREAVISPANWCDITFLHVNIKSCTSEKEGGQWYITLYSGRKYYQPPSDAYPLKLKFRVISQQPRYFNLSLTADSGPLHTKDHRIKVEAAPLDEGKTFLHFSYSYSYGTLARMAIKTYFSTIARDKVGFSNVRGKDGSQTLVTGVRGAVERNCVRYYLAMETYIDSLKLPAGHRLEARLNRWYDLTARYPRQLREMDKAEYLSAKHRERENQIRLQKDLARDGARSRERDAQSGAAEPG
ncbi:hypothetical protein L4X63_16045 [Geomonas sp. Red32]|uniref:hypothetical protein n=1 Tax=Geomonas sp. Red32 TaxID=2912856 RepID=UPI00202CE532|nr:hypothetical protein [Geomonas sp. Red32]MCM0083100.1 hypothetical protein [Geomonas sp. Red32]